MDLDQAVRRLQVDTRDAAAQAALYEGIHDLVRGLVPSDHAEDVATDSYLALWDRLEQGTLVLTGSARGYIRTTLKHTNVNRLRQDKKRKFLKVDEPLPEPEPGEADALTGDLNHQVARALLTRLVAAARQRRQDRYRAAFDVDWDQIQRTVFGREELADIIDEVRGDRSSTAAANSVYKRHERFRQALSETLVLDTGFDAWERELLGSVLLRLVYCQKSSVRDSWVKETP